MEPTHDEMVAFLKPHAAMYEADDFDIEEAIYWFANDYHGGQDSTLYSVLSTSEFCPGPLADGPQDDFLYRLLEGGYLLEDE